MCIRDRLSSVSGNQNIITTDWYWSSTEYDPSNSWYVYMNGGSVNTNHKTSAGREMCIRDSSLSISPDEVGGLIDETLDVIHEAEKNQAVSYTHLE